jgi:hypothetical protein
MSCATERQRIGRTSVADYYDINGYQLFTTDGLELERHFVLASDYDALAARLAEAVKALHEIAHDDGDNALRLKFMAADALIAHNTADSATPRESKA